MNRSTNYTMGVCITVAFYFTIFGSWLYSIITASKVLSEQYPMMWNGLEIITVSRYYQSVSFTSNHNTVWIYQLDSQPEKEMKIVIRMEEVPLVSHPEEYVICEI